MATVHNINDFATIVDNGYVLIKENAKLKEGGSVELNIPCNKYTINFDMTKAPKYTDSHGKAITSFNLFLQNYFKANAATVLMYTAHETGIPETSVNKIPIIENKFYYYPSFKNNWTVNKIYWPQISIIWDTTINQYVGRTQTRGTTDKITGAGFIATFSKNTEDVLVLELTIPLLMYKELLNSNRKYWAPYFVPMIDYFEQKQTFFAATLTFSEQHVGNSSFATNYETVMQLFPFMRNPTDEEIINEKGYYTNTKNETITQKQYFQKNRIVASSNQERVSFSLPSYLITYHANGFAPNVTPYSTWEDPDDVLFVVTNKAALIDLGISLKDILCEAQDKIPCSINYNPDIDARWQNKIGYKITDAGEMLTYIWGSGIYAVPTKSRKINNVLSILGITPSYGATWELI